MINFVCVPKATISSLYRSSVKCLCKSTVQKQSSMPSSDVAAFRRHFEKSKNIVILTGAGVSAESGVPTFRGAGGLWRKYDATRLASPQAFARNPALVWEFYHYRRELVMTKAEPNPAHIAIAACEERLAEEGRRVTVITQNVDELHFRAGTKNLIELHGSLFATRCTKCDDVKGNYDIPICKALDGKGSPEAGAPDCQIPVEQLPKCSSCGGLLRPHIVWFGESLDQDVLEAAHRELENCDICLVVGTSSVVYPAAMFAPQVAAAGKVVAEFNMEPTPVTSQFEFHFQGPCCKTLPPAIA